VGDWRRNCSSCYSVLSLPETIGLPLAALIELLTVAVRAVKNSGFQDFSEKPVLILGGGPIGLAINFVLKPKGGGKVYFSAPTAKKDAKP
jgi:threonine dehydrogenase-like Zn-dependent dehydrogenase